MKLSGELDYRIRYDVEHDLFHAQNVFNDEYVTPTFIEYVQKLEKELKDANEKVVHLACNQNKELKYKLTNAKEIIRKLIDYPRIYGQASGRYKHECDLAEQFISEVEK